MSWFTNGVHIFVAIGGLAFLILIHEAGHFFTALAVKMRPRRFYIFFPPAIVKWRRKGIEYGIGAIPLGGYVKIPGMHKPAGADVEGQFGPAIEEAPWLAAHVEPVKVALDEGRLEDARAGLDGLREALERSELSDPARKHKGFSFESHEATCRGSPMQDACRGISRWHLNLIVAKVPKHSPSTDKLFVYFLISRETG